jgi:LmbE family N-acetylglucosaminyl deacetylase
MRKNVKLWFAILWCAGVSAQQTVQVSDPANLTGEHVAPQSPADTAPINHGAAALLQLLLKLHTRASMMLIVAHPDDEDGGMLTYESRGQGARVAMLTLNRGEGGQNLMSGDFEDALGLIRTQELLAADRYMGVDQMFGTVIDFGFSKTKEESFAKWTHERVLYDAVRAVRLYRPLVIASVFVGGPTDGHGQHQVSGEIAQEVYKAAADPNVFPEMLKEGLLPWAPLKVYARVPFSRVATEGMFDYATGKTIPVRFENYVTGKVTNTPPVATVTIHEGDAAVVMGRPALGMDGMSWVQFARIGLGLQKTQIGAGVRTPPPGRSDSGYTLMGSRLASTPAKEDSLFDGIDISLPGIADLAPSVKGNHRILLVGDLTAINRSVQEAQADFKPDHPGDAANRLKETLIETEGLIAEISRWSSSVISEAEKFNILHELRIKRVQLNNALVLALGLSFDASIPEANVLSTATSLLVETKLSNDGEDRVSFHAITLPGTVDGKIRYQDQFSDGNAAPHAAATHEGLMTFPAGLPPTRPYFSRKDIQQPVYDIAQPDLRNAPATPAPLVVTASVAWGGVELEMSAAIHGPEVAGRVPESTVVIPPVSIAVAPSVGIIRPQEKAIHLTARIDGKSDAQSPGGVTLFLNNGSKGYGESLGSFSTRESKKAVGKEEYVSMSVPMARIKTKSVTLTAVVAQSHKDYAESFQPVGYPGLTYTNYYSPATYRATTVDATTAPGLKVAYLPGTGDAVPDFLPDLGVTPVLITPKDLNAESLKQYDAVVLGVRAYAAQSALAGKGSEPLIDYARNGGVVIVQYMTAKYGDAEAPYPITVPGDSSHNVVVEEDAVTLLEPESALLTWPNKITSADFDHWAEERGHGFAMTWDSHYQALLEMHDPEQDPQRGGLLLASVGKGAYIYCSLALYRQLPEGVPGAYRLFANLLSYGKNPKR